MVEKKEETSVYTDEFHEITNGYFVEDVTIVLGIGGSVRNCYFRKKVTLIPRHSEIGKDGVASFAWNAIEETGGVSMSNEFGENFVLEVEENAILSDRPNDMVNARMMTEEDIEIWD